MKRKIIIPSLLSLIGLAIIGTAVFADMLGLDPSTGWGRRRIALLIFGALIMFFAVR